MSMIVDLIIKRMATHLKSELQTKIASSSPTRAALVKPYRFQVSPLENPIYAYVVAGDESDPGIEDRRISATQVEDLKMYVPYGEVGGGHYWWRRFSIGIGCFFTTQRYEEEKAADYAHTFLGRVLYQAERVTIADLVDEYGERAQHVAVYASNYIQGGGPDDQYIWRGSVRFQVLTHRPL